MGNLLRSDLSIGGLRVALRLEGFAAEFADGLRRRYAPFRRPGGDARLTLRLEPALPRRSPRDVLMTADRLARHDFDVRLEGRTAHGRVVPNPYAFDSLLRVVWTRLLADAGGGLFHAAGARVGGRAFLFPGRSGAGKSTLARKVRPPARVLSDELVPVRRTRRGWEAYGAPFWGEFRAGRATPGGARLEAVAFLRKGRTPGLRRVSTAEATRRLLETYLSFGGEARDHLAFAARLAAEVPCVELTSALGTPFRTLIGSFL